MTYSISKLGTSVVLLASVFASTANAEHCRTLDNYAFTAQRQAVQYVRHLRYHLPQVAGIEVVQNDALNIYCGMNDLQKAVLFLGEDSRSRRQLHRQLQSLIRLVRDARRNVDNLRADLRHDNHGFFEEEVHSRVSRPRGVQVRFGRGFQIQFAKDRAEPRHHNHGGFNRERAELRVMHHQLDALERTLKNLGRAMHR